MFPAPSSKQFGTGRIAERASLAASTCPGQACPDGRSMLKSAVDSGDFNG
jgi:hypothetical protein